MLRGFFHIFQSGWSQSPKSQKYNHGDFESQNQVQWASTQNFFKNCSSAKENVAS